MRVFTVLLLASLLVIGCTGCSTNEFYLPQDQISPNYNNVSVDNSFWLTKDVCYYSDAPLFEFQYYGLTAEGRKQLCTSSSGSFAKVHYNDDTLYMLDYGAANGIEEAFRLHSYHTISKEHNVLTHLKDVASFFVHKEYLYYDQEYDNGTSWEQPLWVYSLKDGTTKKIAQNIFQMGIMKDTPVFLEKNDEVFQLYNYDPIQGETQLLGDFSVPLSHGEVIMDFVSFTSEQVILTVSMNGRSRVVCYNIGSDQISSYVVDGDISSLIAYEKFAFMISTDWDYDKELDEQQHTVSRICLSTGTLEQITKLEGMVEAFVGSDDSVYLYMVSVEELYNYNINGDKQLVGKL